MIIPTEITVGKTHKRKRAERKFASFRKRKGIYFCRECKEPIKTAPHHVLCNKCWRKKQNKKSGIEKHGISSGS